MGIALSYSLDWSLITDNRTVNKAEAEMTEAHFVYLRLQRALEPATIINVPIPISPPLLFSLPRLYLHPLLAEAPLFSHPSTFPFSPSSSPVPSVPLFLSRKPGATG